MEEVKKQGMESLFVPYEIALALKELRFEEGCLTYYFIGGKMSNYFKKVHRNSGVIQQKPYQFDCTAPLYQQAFRWFREKYGLSSCIHLKMLNSKRKIWYNICELDNRLIQSMYFKSYPKGFFNTYEEAELECIKKLIEIVKQNINLPEVDETIDGSRI